jgi:cyclophilin family peptidyl-prolyl cis-trans isomerase/protein-disulfide isomerase
VVSRPVTPDPENSLVAPVGDGDWVIGPEDAGVTIIEYSEFQCEGCAVVGAILARLVQEYPQEVRVVFRHFPLISIHDKAALSAQAAEAAGAQGKFWQMHDLLFTRQAEWGALTPEAFEEWLLRQAAGLGLDSDAFKKDLTSTSIVQKVQAAWDDNSKTMPGTPYLVINGEAYQGRLAYQDMQATVALMLLAQRQFPECPPITIDPARQYLAEIKTEKGVITVELFADLAPLTVNSFVFLARQGWFDNITFHRVIPGFMAQGGDPTGTGFGGPGYAFDNEDNGLTFDQPGVLAMANAGRGSNGSQFFITYAPVERLNGGYTIFGKVLSGMDVLNNLTPRDPAANPDAPAGDKIISITIVEK